MAHRRTAPLVGKLTLLATLAAGAVALAWNPGGGGTNLPLATTVTDFVMPGTQELTLTIPLASGDACSGCHGGYDDAIEPFSNWAASMMGQATRDPMWYAAMAIANQDASFVGDYCIRCHTPNGWLAGKSVPTDGSALDVFNGDFDGVGCHFCHRSVDPIYTPDNPVDDVGILAGLTTAVPTSPHTGQYIVDPDDNRRGPYDLGPNFGYHEWRESPWHRDSAMCGTCHDVGNPAFSRQPDGTYKLNPVNQEHPTHERADYFPEQRTYSEWLGSQFAKEEIEMNGLFGGNKTAVSSCQDCHMPDVSGEAAGPIWGAVFRNDMPLHQFNGANTWVLRAVRSLYPDFETGLTASTVDAAINRTKQMLQNAAELEAFERNGQIVVRVLNNSGHKLPTGYAEGRRMWLNVRYLDGGGQQIGERGAYDLNSATLSENNTMVWKADFGLDDYMAGVTGLPAGKSFHLALVNTILKDNRIPPRGFNQAAFAAAGSFVIGEEYYDEQFWHDSQFTVPAGTASVEVGLYYQTTAKDYVEFLRDNNTTDNAGMVAFRAWEAYGKSEPVLMQSTSITLASAPCPPPIDYGYVIPNSSGNEMKLSFSGTPSASAGNFTLEITDGVPNVMMGVFAGTESRQIQMAGGLFLVGGTVNRLMPVFLDGQGKASIPLTIPASASGEEIYFQALCRDVGTAGNLAYSNGLHVDLCD